MFTLYDRAPSNTITVTLLAAVFCCLDQLEVCIGYNIPEGLQLLRIKKNKALPAHRTTRPTNQAMTNGLCKTGCMRGGSLGIIIAA